MLWQQFLPGLTHSGCQQHWNGFTGVKPVPATSWPTNPTWRCKTQEAQLRAPCQPWTFLEPNHKLLNPKELHNEAA